MLTPGPDHPITVEPAKKRWRAYFAGHVIADTNDALILREAAETPGRTAALVSPDRLLARRVAVRLEAWGIRVDDSAGRPFAKTPPGTFLDLTIAAITDDFSPTAVMALLKHPLTRLGLDAFAARRAARLDPLEALRSE